MLKRMLGAACAILLGAAEANEFGGEIALPLLEAGTTQAFVPAADLKSGESGIIQRWLDAQHAVIIARAVVGRVEEGRAEIHFEVFDALAQEALPVPKLLPRKNDEAIIRKFYNRGMVIAPNQELYGKVTAAYPHMSWVHPDLMASHLAIEGTAAPGKAEFRSFCNDFNVGILYVINNNQGQALDCQTFAPLKSDYITGRVKKEETVLPFFSRLGTLEADLLDLKGEISDYYAHYDRLLSGALDSQDSSFFEQAMQFIKAKL